MGEQGWGGCAGRRHRPSGGDRRAQATHAPVTAAACRTRAGNVSGGGGGGGGGAGGRHTRGGRLPRRRLLRALCPPPPPASHPATTTTPAARCVIAIARSPFRGVGWRVAGERRRRWGPHAGPPPERSSWPPPPVGGGRRAAIRPLTGVAGYLTPCDGARGATRPPLTVPPAVGWRPGHAARPVDTAAGASRRCSCNVARPPRRLAARRHRRRRRPAVIR